ncbi:MAG: hypothetical protein JWM33_415 [Caulobacteraceae bacterium]|nr:hypothetical protein [Caulobacteraceae bacterium]
MRRFALVLLVSSLASSAWAQGEFARPAPPAAPAAPAGKGLLAPRPPKPPSRTMPPNTHLSAAKAVGFLAKNVCLPGLFGGEGPSTLAPYFKLGGTDPGDAGGHANDRAWSMKSSTDVYVIGFADGACGISSGNGSGGDYKGEVALALTSSGKAFKAGDVKDDKELHLTTSTYCTDGANPAVVRIAVPTLGFHTPHNIQASFFTAKAGRPADCPA